MSIRDANKCIKIIDYLGSDFVYDYDYLDIIDPKNDEKLLVGMTLYQYSFYQTIMDNLKKQYDMRVNIDYKD